MIASAPDVLRWLRAVQARAELTPAHRCVAMALALRVNGKTGLLCPSKAQLQEDTQLSEFPVRQAVAALRGFGLLAVDQSNGRTANRYSLTIPRTPMPETGLDTLNPDSSNPVAGNPACSNPDAGIVQPRFQNRATPIPATTVTDKGTDKGTGEEREREKRASRAVPSRCPPDWEPDAKSREWIESFGLSVEEARPAIIEFREYWSNRTTKRANWQRSFNKNGKVEGTLIRLRDAKTKRITNPRWSGPEPTGAACRPPVFED